MHQYPSDDDWQCLFAIFNTSALALLAIICSSGIVLQILACALYNNWWPMLTAIMYVMMPMPCLFFGGGDSPFVTSEDAGGWLDAAKFFTGASVIGSIAIPSILTHAKLIELGAMFLVFASLFMFACTAILYFHMSSEEYYSYSVF
eukprot:TRINITY_DN1100_c0_g1_i3.p1 TRINITY_DN1100_c0_g1~~TRINITY_DN1100_c0_g1_i3.p1  ORF type:complete len:146 (+),score=11.83 TRINITY_DN1100_c0_g1_i3:1064-1501(+)